MPRTEPPTEPPMEGESSSKPVIADEGEAQTGAEPIDGGFVTEGPQYKFDERRHRAQTASKLAVMFAWILAGALGVHYIAITGLGLLDRGIALTNLSDAMNVWFPALVGIVSTTATYYFTKERG